MEYGSNEEEGSGIKPSKAPTTAQVTGSMPLFVPIATTVKNVATSTVTLDYIRVLH